MYWAGVKLYASFEEYGQLHRENYIELPSYDELGSEITFQNSQSISVEGSPFFTPRIFSFHRIISDNKFTVQ